MKKTLLSLLIAASLGVTAGCSDSPSSPKVAQKPTLSGTAAKGIIQSGIVTAVEMGADGEDIDVVGSTTTDAAGHYELKLADNYAGGVVRLTITGDANTTMKCDVFDGCGEGKAFGSTLTLAEGFALNAIIKPSTDSVKVQITPLTHMATARAMAAATLDADSVASAISEVNQIVGVNIMENAIVDISDPTQLESASTEAKQLALFNAGLAELLVSDDDTLANNLSKLASSFADGQFTADDAITIGAITSAVGHSASLAGNNAEVGEVLKGAIADIGTVVAVINSQTGDNGYNPEPGTNSSPNEIAQAKAIVTDARTFIEKIGSDFEQPLDALSIDVEAAGAVLDEDTAAMGQLLGGVMAQVFTALEDENFDLKTELASPKVGGYAIEIFDNAESLGTVTAIFSSSTDGVSIALNGQLSGNVDGASRTIDIKDITISTNLTSEQMVFDAAGVLAQLSSVADAKLEASGELTTSADGASESSIKLNSVSLAVSFADELATVNLETLGDGGENEQEVLSSLSAASFSGSMTIKADGVTFDGDAEIKLIALAEDKASIIPLSLQKIALNGTFSDAKGEFTAGASLMVNNAATFDTFGFLNSTSQEEYSEEPDSFESADYFLNATLMLSAKANLTELPEAAVIATLNRKALEGGNATITVSYNGKSFTLDAASANVSSDTPEAVLTLTNPDGLKLVANLQSNANNHINMVGGTVAFNGTQIGTISETDNGIVLVRYNDGTFDSLY